MMRPLRRAMRQWGREFLTFWGRFTAFHRIVIGIILAMGIVFGARSHLLDPRDRELAAKRKVLADKGIPAYVPSPELDEDVQKETLRAENLRRSLENRVAVLTEAEAVSDYRLTAGKADANAALLALASRHGLHVLKNTEAPEPVAASVPVTASAYELAGTYPAIYSFLDDVQREPLLWRFRDLSLMLSNGSEGTRAAAPVLVLRFTLVMHVYRGGGV